MRFLVDTNLPRALCGWLASKGHEASHLLDLDLAQAEDAEIWQAAIAASAIVVSKDEDFADLVRIGVGASVVWVRTGNGTNRQLISYFETMWPLIEHRLVLGDRLIEVR